MLQGSEFGCFHPSSPGPATHNHSYFRPGGGGCFHQRGLSSSAVVSRQVGLSRVIEATSKHAGTVLNCVTLKDVTVLIPSSCEYDLIRNRVFVDNQVKIR